MHKGNEKTQRPGQIKENTKLKIVFVQHALPPVGGAEQVLYDLITGLDREAFDPVLCCLHELGELGEKLRQAGCRTYDHVAKGRYDPLNVTRLAAILRRERAEIVHVTDAFHNMVIGRLAALIARTPQTVLSFHCYDTFLRKENSLSRRLMLALSDRLLHRSFHRVIALAEHHKQYLVSTKRISAARISVIHNGINHHRFAIDTSVRDARSRFGLPHDKHIVGIVAALRPCKAHEMFLQAAARVRDEEPDTVFVIAGDGPERQKLERVTRELELVNHVRFVGHVDDVPTLLRALDVSALSSYSEAFPLAVLEPMAAGKPVVSTDVGSVCEIVDNGVNGFRVPFGAADAFAEAILRVLRDPDLARRLGESGRKKVEEMFTIDHMVDQTESLFHELVHQPGGPASAPRESGCSTAGIGRTENAPVRSP